MRTEAVPVAGLLLLFCGPSAAQCVLVQEGTAPRGEGPLAVQVVASGLEVPWGLGFLPSGDFLVTERPGRIRRVRPGDREVRLVARVPAVARGEGGLLGLAIHPDFAENRAFYVYFTASTDAGAVNRVERWRLSEDADSATRERVIIDGIPAARYHDGGRIRFGPDGMLYIGTGDARRPELAQDRESLAGKILRLTPDGRIPSDNPWPNNPAYLIGLRNPEGFDWWATGTMMVADHGPTGELGRTGHDEVSVATAGANLGWPVIYGCQVKLGMVTPSITWREAVPPGGAVIYRGSVFPKMNGDVVLATLASKQLVEITFSVKNSERVLRYQGYLPGRYGRLRTVVVGPDGALYVTTSNCDGRGTCPPEGDRILRITR